MKIFLQTPTSGGTLIEKEIPLSYGDIVDNVSAGDCMANFSVKSHFGLDIEYGNEAFQFPKVDPSEEWKVVDFYALFPNSVLILLVSRDFRYIALKYYFEDDFDYFCRVVRRDVFRNKESIKLKTMFS